MYWRLTYEVSDCSDSPAKLYFTAMLGMVRSSVAGWPGLRQPYPDAKAPCSGLGRSVRQYSAGASVCWCWKKTAGVMVKFSVGTKVNAGRNVYEVSLFALRLRISPVYGFS